ncbi:MAG: flagellar hook-length control protein FliK [Candidatus Neomarinimicrobiota bacterium]
MMNSGGAQVSQAGSPQLTSMKGKGNGALAASLAGSLFSLVPGAGKSAQGFEGLLQQLLGHLPGLGKQLTRKPVVAGQNPPEGQVISRPKVAAPNRRSTGSANAPVLRFGEATWRSPTPQIPEGLGIQVPGAQQEGVLSSVVVPAEEVSPGGASMKASKQPGSGAGFPASGQVPRHRPASHTRSQPGLGTSPSRQAEGVRGSPPDGGSVPTRKGRVLDGGKPAEPAGVMAKAGVVTNTRASGVQPTVNTAGQQSESEGTAVSSRSAGVHGNSRPARSAGPPTGKPAHVLPAAGNNQSDAPSSGVQRPSDPSRSDSRPGIDVRPSRPRTGSRISSNRMQVHTEPDHSPQGINGKAKGVTSGMVVKQPHPRVPLTRSDTVEPRPQGGADGNPAEGRISNQGRLGMNLPQPDRPVVPVTAQGTSGSTSSSRAATERSTGRGTSRVRIDGQRSAASLRVEDSRGSGSHSATSLTNQDGLRRSPSNDERISRGFVKPVQVGVQRSGERWGDESPAPLTHSLPTSAPAPLEVSASLASLARLTVLYYSRFAGGEQRSSVFTFNGGSLGNVQLTFQESNAATTLHIVVESPEARQMLQRALPNLEQEWAHQGLNFSDVNVEVGDTGRGSGFLSQGNPTRTPALESAVIDEVAADEESEGVRNYGYNTVEFVA